MRCLSLTLACLFLMLGLAGCDMAKGWQLEKAVVDALAADQRTAASVFEVSAAADGSVTITGEVATPQESDAVTEIAKAVPGVTQVLNNTAVAEIDNGMMQDTVLTTPFM